MLKLHDNLLITYLKGVDNERLFNVLGSSGFSGSVLLLYKWGNDIMNTKDLYDMYNECLDEVCDIVRIGTMEYLPSRVLAEVDPIAYKCGFDDWLDSQNIDSNDLED